MQKRKSKIKGYVTGIDQIDLSWGGLKDGELYCFFTKIFAQFK